MVSSSAPPEVSMQRTFPSQLSGQWSLICEVKGWRAWDCSPLDLSPICPNTSDPFTRDVEGLEWISVFTAYISSTETAAACVQCAASLNYFSRHPRTLPAVSPCCNLSVTSPKNTPPPFSFPLRRSRYSAFIQKKSLSSGIMTAKGCYQKKNYIKKRV